MGQERGVVLEQPLRPDGAVITRSRPGASPTFWAQCGARRGPKAMPPCENRKMASPALKLKW
jgi:hypothetical protein